VRPREASSKRRRFDLVCAVRTQQMYRAGWLSEHRRTTDGAAHATEVDVNPTYEMSRAGSEHGDNAQWNQPVNQLPFLHRETSSHDVVICTSLLLIVSGVKGNQQELLCKSSCHR
jgi:hypothetical protein